MVNTDKQLCPLYIVVNVTFSNKTYTTAAMKTVKASKQSFVQRLAIAEYLKEKENSSALKPLPYWG